jgi:hypothetical protein
LVWNHHVQMRILISTDWAQTWGENKISALHIAISSSALPPHPTKSIS